MKTCTKCNKEKEESQFSFKSREKGILSAACKECHSLYSKSHYKNNTQLYVDKAKIYNEKQVKLIKSILDEARANGCIYCPEKDPICLDFHHLYDKEYNIAHMRHHSESKVRKELAKCEVVCANCHRKIHRH